MSLPSYAPDAMIYAALASIDLQTSYFSSYNNPKDNGDMENLRDEYKMARHTILNKRIGYWSYKRADLVLDSDDKPGWYRAPSDLIAWYRPTPQCTAVGKSGQKIYQLSGNSIVYVHDPEDLTGIPIEIVMDIRDYFLLRLASRGKISVQKMEQIRANAIVSERNAGELCHMWSDSKSRINYGY